MPVEILMPALSPTMTEGNLTKWRKKEGDKVKSGDVLAEIETDKATMEVEAVDEGVLGKIIIPEGSKEVKVNSLIALILEDGEDSKSLSNYQPKSKVSKNVAENKPLEEKLTKMKAEVTTEYKVSNERIFASPLARKIAEQNNVNLTGISGTGPRGRVVKADVLASGSARKCASVNFVRDEREFEILSITNMRKVIASRLVESKQTVPHFYLSIDCNMDALLEMRASINRFFAENKSADKISVNDLIIKASAMALRDVPNSNVSWTDEGIYRYNNVDISVAVSIEGGLITPLIRNADHKTISTISTEMKSLANRARTTGLAPHEFQGGGFSISNLGMYGITQFNAIISPPQGCILAVGATEKRAIVIDDEIKIASMMTLTLSCDHRVVDGAVGAEFLASLRKYLESPIMMMKDWI